jgi:hypothetical protein
MPDYRAYVLNSDNSFKTVTTFRCEDDDTAIAEATKLLDGRDIELWDKGRKVATLLDAV